MKRKSFIAASVLSVLGIGGFSIIRWTRHTDKIEVLAQPKFLLLLCNKKTIRKLGQAYLELRPDETTNETLLNALLVKRSTKVENPDLSKTEIEIEKKIKDDFDTDNIVVVQGWVLSITEARQCALFSILNS